MNTPILFIIFNRSETSLAIFEVIKKIKPSKLFIASDGPRNNIPGEKENCEALQTKILELIDWECEINTLFRRNNLGVKIGVSSAIDWFFEHNNHGIILEHDCLPNESFFRFCQEMLEKYKDNEAVMHISGNFFQPVPIGDGDYYFSKIPHIWGWATWKRAWKKYNINMPNFEEFKKNNILKDYFKNDRDITTWKHLFSQVYYNKSQTWDFQWTYAIFKNNGLAITPNKNLVSNIGFGSMAENCKDENDKFANLGTKEMSKIIKAPEIIAPSISADIWTTRNNFNFTSLKYILIKLRLFNLSQKIYGFIK